MAEIEIFLSLFSLIVGGKLLRQISCEQLFVRA